jgi:N-hydroxyarylamine O-acetyltransferase
MDIARYLVRIGAAELLAGDDDHRDQIARPDLDTLRVLMQAHLHTIPFENLDIHLQIPIALDYQAIYDKIVNQQRGGFCYELNGLFGYMLGKIGYEVDFLSARVTRGDSWDYEFGHMALLVVVDGRRYLVDVGYGDSIRAPMKLVPGTVQRGIGREYRLVRHAEGLVLEVHGKRGMQGGYLFRPVPRRLSDFAEMCRYHQTSPRSWFTQKRLCTLATPTGRVTLAENTLIRTEDGDRTETELDDDDCALALKQQFGLALDVFPDNRKFRTEQRLRDSWWVLHHRAKKLWAIVRTRSLEPLRAPQPR